MLQKIEGREAAELPTNQKLLENLYERAGKQLDDWKAAGRVFLEAYGKFEADLASREILRGQYRQAWFASTGESKPVWLGADDAAAKRIPEPRQLFTLDPEIGKHLELGKVEALLNGLCDLQENALEWNLSRRARLLAATAVEGLISKVRELREEIAERLSDVPPHRQEPLLNPKQKQILQAMLQAGATENGTPLNQDKIGQVVVDPLSCRDSVKDQLARLQTAGLVRSRPGRGGGMFLTSEGADLAQKLSE